mmetsp:Transcript_93433/g.241853  ORF Transcript_93433/g.241853 Transcript_93433/m.241853 type:complete len:203 (-) Transcript_93433:226-834(-)
MESSPSLVTAAHASAAAANLSAADSLAERRSPASGRPPSDEVAARAAKKPVIAIWYCAVACRLDSFAVMFPKCSLAAFSAALRRSAAQVSNSLAAPSPAPLPLPSSAALAAEPAAEMLASTSSFKAVSCAFASSTAAFTSGGASQQVSVSSLTVQARALQYSSSAPALRLKPRGHCKLSQEGAGPEVPPPQAQQALSAALPS